MELADKILQLRKDKGWTQAIAAKNIAIQQSYLSKLENGQYQPSTDVIEKLCSAYQISINDLLPKAKVNQKTPWPAYSSALFGLTLIIFGHFALIFPQSYYTYKTVPMQTSPAQMQTSYYHVTDEYLGDNYVRTLNGIRYEYTLMAVREINRKENRGLIAAGILILFVPFIFFFKFIFKKPYP